MGVEKFKSCLTGFKGISQLIETHPELNFIAGGEESCFYQQSLKEKSLPLT